MEFRPLKTAAVDTSTIRTITWHSLVFQRQNGELSRLALPNMTAVPEGVLLIGVGRGVASETQAPVDLASGIEAFQLQQSYRYTKYPASGTALYSHPTHCGSSPPRIITQLPTGDEVTVAAVHVIRTHVQDVSWKEAYPGKIFGRNVVRSAPVHATGPATLVAFWWGDAGVRGDKTALPGQGFRVLDSLLAEGALVQCAVAVKEVEAAGKYDVAWTATPRQAAQLWLVALQETPKKSVFTI